MAETKPTQGGAAGHTPEPGQQERNEQNVRLQGSQSTGAQQGGQGQQVEVGQRGQGGAMQQGGEGAAMQQRGQQGLARYGRDPFTMIQRLSEEMDELFDSFFYGRPVRQQRGSQSQLSSIWAPDVELCEEGNQLRVCVDLPGVSKDNVKVDIHEGVLTIQGERREERTEGGEQQGFRRSERRYGSFYRSIPLPEGADLEQAQARMRDGVLEITLPMTPPKQAKRLQIQG